MNWERQPGCFEKQAGILSLNSLEGGNWESLAGWGAGVLPGRWECSQSLFPDSPALRNRESGKSARLFARIRGAGPGGGRHPVQEGKPLAARPGTGAGPGACLGAARSAVSGRLAGAEPGGPALDRGQQWVWAGRAKSTRPRRRGGSPGRGQAGWSDPGGCECSSPQPAGQGPAGFSDPTDPTSSHAPLSTPCQGGTTKSPAQPASSRCRRGDSNPHGVAPSGLGLLPCVLSPPPLSR